MIKKDKSVAKDKHLKNMEEQVLLIVAKVQALSPNLTNISSNLTPL